MGDNVEETQKQNAENSDPATIMHEGEPVKRGNAKTLGWLALFIVGIGMMYFGSRL